MIEKSCFHQNQRAFGVGEGMRECLETCLATCGMMQCGDLGAGSEMVGEVGSGDLRNASLPGRGDHRFAAQQVAILKILEDWETLELFALEFLGDSFDVLSKLT